MSSSRLKPNSTKTEVLWLGSSHQLSQSTLMTFHSSQRQPGLSSQHATSALLSTPSCHCQHNVAALCRSGFYHRQRRPVLRSLTHEAARTLVQAFISCRLDYCTSLLYGVSHGNIRKVQSVQNAAARLLTGTRRGDISPVLRQLHWLPVQRRVDFKLACFVFSSLSG